MLPKYLRKLDLYLLRNHPNLWALRLPELLVGVFLLSAAALVVAYETPVELDDMPAVGNLYVVWLLLAALPFGYWVVLFMRVQHPVLRDGALARALSIIGVVAACVMSLAPAGIYVVTLEARMAEVVEPLKEEIEAYSCVSANWAPGWPRDGSPLGAFDRESPVEVCDYLRLQFIQWKQLDRCVGYPTSVGNTIDLSAESELRALVEEFESQCVDGPGAVSATGLARLADEFREMPNAYDVYAHYWSESVRAQIKKEVAAKLGRLVALWGNPIDGERDPEYEISKSVALAIASGGFEASLFFPYRRAEYRWTLLFVLGYFAYVLTLARSAPWPTSVWALVLAAAVFALAWVASTIEPANVLIAPMVHFCVLFFGCLNLVTPEKSWKNALLFELWLCMIPLMGFSFVLATQQTGALAEDMLGAGVRVCWATILITPLIHAVAEGYRSRPQ